MADLNIMSLYTDSYLADTIHLSTEEHGAYLLMLVAMWRSGGELSDDPVFLQRITKVPTKRWPKIWEEIGPFFVSKRQGIITQKRLQTEYDKALHRKEVASLNGRQGGRPKPLTNKKAAKATGSNPVKQNGDLALADQKPTDKQNGDLALADQKPIESSPYSLLLTPLSSVANSESEKPGSARQRLEELEAKCRQAAGLENDASPSLLILHPIIALLGAGYDLDTDVLPVLRAKARAGAKGRSWGYYVDAIKDSRSKARSAVGNGHLTPPKSAEIDEKRWREMWDWWMKRHDWPMAWGPDPDSFGCEIPKDVIERWRAEP